MRRARTLTLAALVALAPGLALAEGFYTRDLGDGGTPDGCMNRAEQALNAYVAAGAGPNAVVARGTWSVDAYHLGAADVAVQMVCPYRNSIVSIVLLTAHSMGPESERIAVVDAIAARWDAAGQGGGGAPSK